MAEHRKEANTLTLERTSCCTVFGQDRNKFAAQFKKRRAGKGDLTITVSEQSTKVHKAVLIDKSDYFKSMFSGPFTETDSANIDLSASFTNLDELDPVFNYMYTGYISLSEKNIASVLSAANVFLLTELKLACAEFLTANIVPSTCMSIFALAEQFHLKKVKDGCLEVIKAWFPFYIWKSREALEMSPDCLEILIKENVFDLMPNDVKKPFMQQWYEHFKKTNGKNASLPTELKGLIEVVEPLPEPKESVASEGLEDDVEEVLLTVVVPRNERNALPSMKSFEVLAFSPSRKTWKSVLDHTFSKRVTGSSRNPADVEHLVGITEEKAYFVLEHNAREKDIDRGLDEDKRYVVAVDLKSKAETVIDLPEGTTHTTCYNDFNACVPVYIFLWDGRLSAFFVDYRTATWTLYFNEHESKCSKTCTGQCWDDICELPREGHRMVDYDTLAIKVVENNLYVGLLTQEGNGFRTYHNKSSGKVQAFCISENTEKVEKGNEKNTEEVERCKVMELPAQGEYKDLRLPILSWSSDPETATLVLSLRVDDDKVLCRNVSHQATEFVYDLKTAKWVNKVSCKVTYPEPVPRVLEVTRKIRNIELDDSGFYEKERCINGYFIRDTSPFNTSIWKSESKEWQLITHLPCPANTLALTKTAELRLGFYQALPSVSFEDLSKQIRQSPVPNIRSRNQETDFMLEYQCKKMLRSSTWEFRWRQFQQGQEVVSSDSEEEYEEEFEVPCMCPKCRWSREWPHGFGESDSFDSDDDYDHDYY